MEVFKDILWKIQVRLHYKNSIHYSNAGASQSESIRANNGTKWKNDATARYWAKVAAVNPATETITGRKRTDNGEIVVIWAEGLAWHCLWVWISDKNWICTLTETKEKPQTMGDPNTFRRPHIRLKNGKLRFCFISKAKLSSFCKFHHKWLDKKKKRVIFTFFLIIHSKKNKHKYRYGYYITGAERELKKEREQGHAQ